MRINVAPAGIIASAALLALVSAGCNFPDSPSPPATEPTVAPMNDASNWGPTLSVDEAHRLTGDEAKAILIARAFVEKRDLTDGRPAPQIIEYHVSREKDLWAVMISFGSWGDDGRPIFMAGNFVTVYIDPLWNVVRIVGGA